jgi:uncharacterized protein (DUF1697 family)
MAQVVFLRGVNVGGHKTFRPAEVAKKLADLDVVNIGAAGTFVVRKKLGPAALKAKLLEALEFDAELMICPDRDLLDLTDDDPFVVEPGPKDAKRYVTIMAKPAKAPPRLPITQPAGPNWEVWVFALWGRYAFSHARRLGERVVYPNAVIEKHLGIAATTRNWNTIEAIVKILRGSR